MRAIFLSSTALFIAPIHADATLLHRGTAAPVVCNFVTGVATGVGAGTCVSVLPTCDGTTDDTASFDAFATWAKSTWQASNVGLIQLFIPSGACSLTTVGQTFNGIKKLLISAYGMTLNGTYYHLGGAGQKQGSSNSTRLVSVSAGATSVTVNPTSTSQPDACNSNATCTALFSVGGWAMIAGMDMQAGSGFPSNPALFQYVHITGINASTGVISFDAPLADTYLSTWPNYNKGNSLVAEPDDGGPATLYAFDPGWDMEIEWRGITFNGLGQQACEARLCVMRDVAFTNLSALVAYTQNRELYLYNANLAGLTIEYDKMMESAYFDNVMLAQVNFQSANKNFTFRNNSTITNFVGTAANMTITDSTVTGIIKVGPTLYGRGNILTVTNSAIASVGDTTFHNNFGATFSGNTSGSTGFQNIPGLSVSSGVIGIPNAYIKQHASDLNVVGWTLPGTNACWQYDANSCASTFQIQGVTQDGSGNASTVVTISNASPSVAGLTAHGRAAGDVVSFFSPPNTNTLPSPLVVGTLYYVIAAGLTPDEFKFSATPGGTAINTTTAGTGPFTIVTGKTYIATNMLGGVLPTVSAGDLLIRNFPNTASYFVNCSVSLDCIGLNAAAAQGLPLNAYSKRTYTNADTGSAAPYWPIYGSLQKLNVTVNTAYTGLLSATITPNTLFGLYLNTAGANVSYVPAIVNTKVAGARTLDATGGYPSSWLGAQSGDTLTAIAASRSATTLFRSVSDDISSDPSHPMSVTIEVVTNPGLVIP